ncbi:MAG TPA: hypothetical protein VK138_01120 [Acidiferrobacterales bacterium]|nr:hypothetical protein [Acidiferrobacterales bacterium]
MHVAKKASRFLFAFGLGFLAFFAAAKDTALSDTAHKVRAAFLSLQSNPNNVKSWEEYLDLFPKTKSEFKQIFDPDDFSELYNNSHEYIFILNSAPEMKRKLVSEKVVSITKGGAPGCCDAWSALHSVAATYAIQDTSSFVSLLKKLKLPERQNVIKFIADQENHRAFEEYQIIINKLKELNENEIAKEFENARTLRMKAKH